MRFWALRELDEKVRRHPRIVKRFFGEAAADRTLSRPKLGDGSAVATAGTVTELSLP